MSYDLAFPDALGRLVSNLVQLEFSLLVALYLQEPTQMPTETLQTLKVGDVLPENHLTSWTTLKDLVSEYNAREKARAAKTVDDRIVDLRDAIAHGRVTMRRDTMEYRLIRFSNPRKTGKVTVELTDTLTMRWLEQQVKFAADAMMVICARIEELKPEVRIR